MAYLAAALALAGLAGQAHAQADGRVAVLETGQGAIVIEFFPGDAPNHVENFVALAESGFYDGTLFHRIIPGFMIQGGDPNTVSGDPATWGTGGPPDSVAAEFNSIKHERGIVSMARSASPDSAGSQFFIVHEPSNFLDGQYTVFGRIATEESFGTLDRIAESETNARDAPVDPGPVRIASVEIRDGSEVGGLLDQGEPARMEDAPEAPEAGQRFEDAGLGISFDPPEGWEFLPVLEQPGAPDAAWGAREQGAISFTMSLTVREFGGTFDEMVAAKDASLDTYEAAGIEILSRERGTVAGLPAYVTVAQSEGTGPGGAQEELRIRDVLLLGQGREYTLTYAAGAGDHDGMLPAFEEALGTVEVEGAPAQDGGGCLVATAAFGSELAPQVQRLREIRDSAVLPTQAGSAFMGAFNAAYYSFSPAAADLLREHPALREAARAAITPMLATLSLMDRAEPGSEAGVAAYGAAVLLLNAGIYVAAPAAAARAICRAAR